MQDMMSFNVKGYDLYFPTEWCCWKSSNVFVDHLNIVFGEMSVFLPVTFQCMEWLSIF